MSKYINDNSNSNIIIKDKYQLKSVIIHSGISILEHYFSLIRDNNSDNWYECNNSKIEIIDKNKFITYTFGEENNFISAYMLFYEKLNENNCYKFDIIELILENEKLNKNDIIITGQNDIEKDKKTLNMPLDYEEKVESNLLFRWNYW